MQLAAVLAKEMQTGTTESILNSGSIGRYLFPTNYEYYMPILQGNEKKRKEVRKDGKCTHIKIYVLYSLYSVNQHEGIFQYKSIQS